MQHISIIMYTVQNGTERYSTERYSTERYSTERYSTERYSTERYRTERYRTERYHIAFLRIILCKKNKQTFHPIVWMPACVNSVCAYVCIMMYITHTHTYSSSHNSLYICTLNILIQYCAGIFIRE